MNKDGTEEEVDNNTIILGGSVLFLELMLFILVGEELLLYGILGLLIFLTIQLFRIALKSNY